MKLEKINKEKSSTCTTNGAKPAKPNFPKELGMENKMGRRMENEKNRNNISVALRNGFRPAKRHFQRPP